jgi:hypothetical protein
VIWPCDDTFVGFSGEWLSREAVIHHEIVTNFEEMCGFTGSSHLMKKLAVRIHALSDEIQKLFHPAQVTVIRESRFAGTVPQIVNVDPNIPESGLEWIRAQALLTDLPEYPGIPDR